MFANANINERHSHDLLVERLQSLHNQRSRLQGQESLLLAHRRDEVVLVRGSGVDAARLYHRLTGARCHYLDRTDACRPRKLFRFEAQQSQLRPCRACWPNGATPSASAAGPETLTVSGDFELDELEAVLARTLS